MNNDKIRGYLQGVPTIMVSGCISGVLGLKIMGKIFLKRDREGFSKPFLKMHRNKVNNYFFETLNYYQKMLYHFKHGHFPWLLKVKSSR